MRIIASAMKINNGMVTNLSNRYQLSRFQTGMRSSRIKIWLYLYLTGMWPSGVNVNSIYTHPQ